MERKEVYSAIDSERNYQDKMPDDRSIRKNNLSQAERLLLIQVCVDRASELWYKEAGETLVSVSEQFRKIAALCVQDGEQNGMPSRDANAELKKIKKSVQV